MQYITWEQIQTASVKLQHDINGCIGINQVARTGVLTSSAAGVVIVSIDGDRGRSIVIILASLLSHLWYNPVFLMRSYLRHPFHANGETSLVDRHPVLEFEYSFLWSLYLIYPFVCVISLVDYRFYAYSDNIWTASRIWICIIIVVYRIWTCVFPI